MTWIRIETNIATNPKVLGFADMLGVSIEAAVGHLAQIWGAVAEHRPSGKLEHVSDAALELWAGWRSADGRFAAAFREAFMVGDAVHDWAAHQGKLVERAENDRRRKRPPLEHSRYIYVMRRQDGLLKIGVSRNPSSRLEEVRRIVGQPVELVGMVPGSYDLEKSLHVELAAYRVDGEWFTDTGPVSDRCRTIGIPLTTTASSQSEPPNDTVRSTPLTPRGASKAPEQQPPHRPGSRRPNRVEQMQAAVEAAAGGGA